MLLLFTACTANRFSLKINNVNVPREIYNYYLAQAENDEKYDDSKDKEEAALELCKKYVAGSSLTDKYGVSLSAEEKVSVSQDTKAQWLYFKSFYQKYSVSKQTLNKIIEHDRMVEDVIYAVYSENGDKPAPNEQIKAFYDANYAPVQIISADFKDENGEPMNETAIKEMTEKFTDMRNSVRSGESMESAAQKYPEFAEYEGEASVLSSFDTSYPDGLFESIKELEKGGTQVYKYGERIYLIHRLDASSDGLYFSLYSKECLKKMKKDEFEKIINTIAQSYKMVYNK